MTWSDGTGSWVDDDEGGQRWEANFFTETLVADGTWRQFTLSSYSTYINIFRQFLQTSVAVDIHDYFDSFVEDYVTITASAGADGSISPSGANAVPTGSNQTYTITPNPGYMVSALVVDGIQFSGVTTHTFSSVTSDHTIAASFAVRQVSVTLSANPASPHLPGTPITFTAVGHGGNGNYDYRFLLFNGTSWSIVQNYGNGRTWTMPANTPVGSYVIDVDVRTSTAVDRDAGAYFSYEVYTGPATGVIITPASPSPHIQGAPVVFTATGQGSTNYDYRFLLFNGTSWTIVQNYGGGDKWTLPANTPIGNYVIDVDVRTSSAVDRDANAYFSYEVYAGPATGVTVTPSQPTPHNAGTAVVFTASGQGSTNYDYRFLFLNGTNWSVVQDYGHGATWEMPASTLVGDYVVAVDVRTSSSVDRDAVTYLPYKIQ